MGRLGLERTHNRRAGLEGSVHCVPVCDDSWVVAQLDRTGTNHAKGGVSTYGEPALGERDSLGSGNGRAIPGTVRDLCEL